MSIIKTSELTGVALDWAVAKCEGGWILSIDSFIPHHGLGRMNYSTDWAQAGPIIERERINLWNEGYDWEASLYGEHSVWGETPLIAAMRCYVASNLGDEVDVPDELHGKTEEN